MPSLFCQADEAQPLLLKRQRPRSVNKRWKRHFAAEVTRDWADLVLILGYFITGLLDTASISVWGSFVSMQTGEPTCENYSITLL